MNTPSTTADDILQTAHRLILAGGYNGFSYADIAKVVGIRNASIHHHFPSKADLVSTLVARYRQTAGAAMAALEESVPDPVGQLRAYIGYWQTCIAEGTASYCLCALLANEMQLLPAAVASEVRAHFQGLSAWLTKVLERGAAGGQIHLASTARIEAEGVMAAVHGAMLTARAYGDPAAFEAITTPVLRRLTPPS